MGDLLKAINLKNVKKKKKEFTILEFWEGKNSSKHAISCSHLGLEEPNR